MALNFDSLFNIVAKVKGEEQVIRFAGQVKNLAGAALGTASALAGLGGALSVGVLVAQIKGVIDYADALNDMSKTTGVSVEALSRLKIAAQSSGTDLDGLQKGIIKLSKVQLEAQKGGEQQIALLKAFGLSLSEIGKLSPDQVLKRIADGFVDLKDPSARAALAMELFGKSGADLIPLLMEGSDGLEKFDRLSDQLGMTISTETAQAADQFNDTLEIIKGQFNGLFVQISADLLPTLTSLAEKFNDPGFREGLAAIAEGAAAAVIKVAELLSYLGGLAKFAGEEAAAAIYGPSNDDIVRLERQRDDVKARLERQRQRFVLIDIGGAEQKLQQELLGVEAKIRDFYARQDEAAKAAAKKVVPGAAAAGGAPAPASSDALQRYLQGLQDSRAKDDAKKKADSAAAREQRQFDSAVESNQKRVAALLAEAGAIGMTTAEREKAIAVAELESGVLAKRPEELAKQKAALEAAYDARRSAQFTQLLRDTTEALDDQIEAMRLETEQIGMSTLEVQLSNIARQYSLELRRLSKDATAAEREELEKLIEAKRKEAEEEAKRRDAMKGDWLAGGRKGLKDYYDSVRDTFSATQQFVGETLKKTEDALVEFFSTGKLNMKAFVADILKELLRLWVRAMIMKPILDAIGVRFPAFGDALKGARALGGGVAGGSAYLVGENGPEIFTPAQSGRITPNNQLGRMGGGDVSIAVNVSADGQTTTTGPDGDAARLGKLIGAKVREIIVQERRLGGLLAPAR